jgi:cell wall-associated NlpC family hydrolase
MLSEPVLDIDGRGIAQTILGAGCVVIAVLLVAMIVPLVVLANLLHSVTKPLSSIAALSEVVSSSPASIGFSPTPPVQQVSPSAPAQSQAVEVARRYLGIPYVFGGTNPAVGLDCSGLVQLVFRQLGMALPRTAQQQYNATQRVSRDQLQPGDLVFFARTYADPNDWVTHVGIYIGNGQQINAPTEGEVVSIQPVFTGFFGDHFIGGGRVASH